MTWRIVDRREAPVKAALSASCSIFEHFAGYLVLASLVNWHLVLSHANGGVGQDFDSSVRGARVIVDGHTSISHLGAR